MRFRRSRQEEVSVNITPLIDVVFLLLIFFMVTTTFTRETQLQIDLPESESALQAEEQRPVEILIDRNGHYAINEQVLIKQDVASIKRALQALEVNASTAIVLTADAQAPHQAFVRALDAVGQMGLVKVSITTQSEAAE